VTGSILTGNLLPLAGAAAPMIAGSGLKALSRGIGNKNVAAVEKLMRGSTPAQLSQLRKMIVEALMHGSAPQLPGYTNQLIGK
jgi:hypothetical protein